jgi:hypothetical protein
MLDAAAVSLYDDANDATGGRIAVIQQVQKYWYTWGA